MTNTVSCLRGVVRHLSGNSKGPDHPVMGGRIQLPRSCCQPHPQTGECPGPSSNKRGMGTTCRYGRTCQLLALSHQVKSLHAGPVSYTHLRAHETGAYL
eukprot:4523967-Pyramimonas_sp.AAC.1